MLLDTSDSNSDPGSGDDPGEPWQADPVPLALDGVLDLHQFVPREVAQLVPDWLDECREAGLQEVRIIHGKGIGTLRTIVWKILDEHPAVAGYGHPSDSSSWGATIVQLKAP